MPAGEMPAGEMPAGEMPAGEMPTPCQEDSECEDGFYCIGEVCTEVPVNEVDFCRLHWPVRSQIEPGEMIAFYARYFEDGLTDVSPQNDASDLVMAEVGMRLSGSVDVEDFRWFPATANAGYDGNADEGELNNDEYMSTLTFEMEGTYEVAARFSVDYGQTWTLCDYGVEGVGSSDGFDGTQAAQVKVLLPCEPGYEYDEDDVCQDIDECLVDNGCDANAQCTNNLGTAPTCDCNERFGAMDRLVLMSMNAWLTMAAVVRMQLALLTLGRSNLHL